MSSHLHPIFHQDADFLIQEFHYYVQIITPEGGAKMFKAAGWLLDTGSCRQICVLFLFQKRSSRSGLERAKQRGAAGYCANVGPFGFKNNIHIVA